MADNQKSTPIELITAYIHGTMTDEQADCLLSLMQSDKKLEETLLKSIVIDSWLGEFYHQTKDLKESITQANSQTSPLPVALSNLSVLALLDTACDWEKKVAPIIHHKQVKPESSKVVKTSAPDTERIFEKSRFSIPFIMVVVAYFSFLSWLCWENEKRIDQSRANSPNFIRVMETIDAQWPDDELPLKRKSGLTVKELNLKSGKILLQYPSGSTLILNGPGRIVLRDQKSVVCTFGNICMDIVAKDTGFEITTPFSTVIDRGTRFSLNVDQNRSILNVIKGRVDFLKSNDESPISLVTGQGGSIDKRKTFKSEKFESSVFTTKTAFATEVSQYIDKQLKVIKETKSCFDMNSNLRARFDYSSGQYGEYPNLSVLGSKGIATAHAYGTQSDEGILPGMKSLVLNNPQARIETNIPGSFSQMTIVMNVRIDRMKKTTNVLFASDNLYKMPGTIAWQAMQDGALRLFIAYKQTKHNDYEHQKDKSDFLVFEVSNMINDQMLGTWMTLAIVFNSQQKRIIQYCDGRRVSSISWPNPIPLCPGKLIIGNNGIDTESSQYGYMDGAIDSFYLFDRVLSHEEIKMLQCGL